MGTIVESYEVVDFFLASLDKMLEFTAPNTPGFVATEDLAQIHENICPEYWGDYE